VFIGRLRKKLGVDVLQTVRGLGYVMEAGGASDRAPAAK
jgi:two-component system OmpR family response regulator